MSIVNSLLFMALVLQTGGEGNDPKKAADQALMADIEEDRADPFTYSYNPIGKRDPFQSYLSRKTKTKGEVKNPLLLYDLSQFNLSGVVWGITNPRAIILDPDNRGHIVRRGTRVGRNRGKVVRILKDELIVAEEFRDPLGKLIVSEYSMKLEKEELK